MRDHRRKFLLAGVILLGSLLPLSARASQSSASAPAVALASNAATRATAVSPPMIDAPGSASASTGQSVALTATASDPDGADVLTITEAGAPPSLVFSHTPSISPATATLSGTLASGDVGSWTIQWQVSDGTFTASTTTALTVTVNNPPVITAPATVAGAVAVDMSFPVLASDPDGDPIQSIAYDAIPPGATFTVNAFRTSGAFDWTPGTGQQGTYTITWTVTSGTTPLSTSATTVLSIGPEDDIPVVTAPGTVNIRANHLLSFTATASDPDGEQIISFTVNGAQNTPLPDGVVWTVNASNTMGTLTWTPTMAQVGTVSLRWHACDAEPFVLCTGPEQYTTKIIVSADRAPVVTAPASVSGPEGSLLTVNVTASDPDGDAIASLSALGLPFGATFSANAAHTAGTLSWIPDFTQAGTYNIQFNASNLLTGSATTAVTVTNQNRPPTANAGGPYSGVAGTPVAFDGSASSDPDGDALTFAWNFGDGGTSSGDKPDHTYAAGGMYAVSLTVTDTGALSGAATTTATITAVFDARVFTRKAFRTLKLNSNKPEWCAQVEPIGGNFSVTDVVASTIVLKYGAQQIHAVSDGKANLVSDTDNNGVLDLEVCFNKTDLRTLFAGLPSGDNTVTVTIEGSLLSGALVRGSAAIDVFASGGALLASVAPNPFNPETKLTFVTRKSGQLRVRLYDVSGRLVRTLMDQSNAGPGDYELHIDGRTGDGSNLSSGTYYYRIEAADGEATGRISIVK